MKTKITVAGLSVVAVLSVAVSCSETHHVVESSPAVVQGNGIVVEEARPVTGTIRVDLRGVGELHIRQGAQEELRVRAEENLLPFLRTDVRAGELVIWKDAGTILNTRPIEYHLTVADLERVALTGAGTIRGRDIATGPLALLSSGAGSMEFIGLAAPSVNVVRSGVGDVALSGSVHEQVVRLSGVGGYHAGSLESVVADVGIGNGVSATVRVRDHLTVTIQGGGTVYYIGDPVVIRVPGTLGNVVQIEG